MNEEYLKANVYKAVFLFLFARERYIDMAARHVVAANLAAPDQKRRIDDGEIDLNVWMKMFADQSTVAANDLDKGLWVSFLSIAIVALLSIGLAFAYGSVDPSLDFNWTRVITFIGTFLASWATLMELGGSFRSWDGDALHELIHPLMFKILFVPGACLIFIGQIL
jgi:hypothetical protein